MSEPKGERLPQHVCLGPGPCPHSECRRNWEVEEEEDDGDSTD